jgi:hypothetical protein
MKLKMKAVGGVWRRRLFISWKKGSREREKE